ncbi:hypothetical protein [Neobacillus vireti]|uniref:hypothetical protein n=1 Tax=Neobacillus vireti TaxID=220686 RepID=UPI00041212C1|nr:hypothetical protein [Neobacillus vireti]
MAKRLIWLFLAISILLIVAPNVLAGSSSFISEEQAGGYEYTITKEGIEYTWTVGYKGNQSVSKENEENREELNHFKHAVRDIKKQFISVWTFASGFLILTILTILLHTKNKLRFKDGGAFIFLFAVIAFGQTVVALTELDSAFSDARFYYDRLLN